MMNAIDRRNWFKSKIYAPAPLAHSHDIVGPRRGWVLVRIFRQTGALSAYVVNAFHYVVVDSAESHPQVKDPILAEPRRKPAPKINAYLARLVPVPPCQMTCLAHELRPIAAVFLPIVFHFLDQRFDDVSWDIGLCRLISQDIIVQTCMILQKRPAQ